MRISDMSGMCMGNLVRRKLRSTLTVLAVVLGTSLITCTVSLGIGMNLRLDQQIAQMGDLTIIQVQNYGRNEKGETLVLDDDKIAQIQAIDGVVVATPVYYPRQFEANLFSGKKDRYQGSWINIIGIYSDAFPLLGFQLVEGEFPKAHQPNSKKPIDVIVGEYTSYEFQDSKSKYNSYVWPEKDAQGNLIKQPFVNVMQDEFYLSSKPTKNSGRDDKEDTTVHINKELHAVGRIKEDFEKGYETSRGIFMDIKDVKALEAEYRKANKITVNQKDDIGYNQAKVKVKSLEDVDRVETLIKEMGYQTHSMESIRKPMQQNVKSQQLFLGTIGGVALLVAAVGIINTMYMSIYERTREIGVMKVLGCRVSSIRTIFLMEAGTIGFLGGCIAVAVSYGASLLMNRFSAFFSGVLGGDSGAMAGNAAMMGGMMMGSMGGMQDMGAGSIPISVIPLWLALSAIGFATLIGLLSGILPSNRAVKISALEAIKHE